LPQSTDMPNFVTIGRSLRHFRPTFSKSHASLQRVSQCHINVKRITTESYYV